MLKKYLFWKHKIIFLKIVFPSVQKLKREVLLLLKVVLLNSSDQFLTVFILTLSRKTY